MVLCAAFGSLPIMVEIDVSFFIIQGFLIIVLSRRRPK